jgi:tetratricopeptide (TPR) repeat protein
LAAVLVTCVLGPGRLYAQCPDGSPPPCPGQRVALDPNRIVILPFRVTAADTLLGQGMAELLAPEFTGESGPLAVNMPTVLRVWRRAGGGAGTPLDPVQARRVAREIGAGRVVDGSIVGLGPRINVTATVTELPAGTTRRVGPLSAPADSLQELVGRLASALLGMAGAAPVNLQIHLTDSPAAMRAYLEGIARFRGGDFSGAAPAFERAFALDTLFARAALMRLVTGGWLVDVAGWDSVTWKVRDRLSAEDRIYLTALLGDAFPAWRSPERNLADRRRAAALLPQSVEAQFELGDYLYHFGSASGIADDFVSARAQLELAYRMDPQFEEVLHLLEIGLYTEDTALVRRMWTAWQRTSADSAVTTAAGRVVARVLRDSTLAVRYDHHPAHRWFMSSAWTIALLPSDEVAQVFGAPAGGDAGSAEFEPWALAAAAINTGRLAWRASTNAAASTDLLAATLALAGDSAVAAFLGGSGRALPWDSIGWGWRLTTAVGFERPPIRDAVVEVIEALRSHVGDLRARTARLDSLVRWDIANHSGSWHPVEGLLLAVAWQALGEPRRALAAVHLDVWELNHATLLAPRLRQEGRLAAIVGDTTRAIRAYRRYLRLRRDADPILIPERDSVQAALARLERR